jgi:hypothetical protein
MQLRLYSLCGICLVPVCVVCSVYCEYLLAAGGVNVLSGIEVELGESADFMSMCVVESVAALKEHT